LATTGVLVSYDQSVAGYNQLFYGAPVESNLIKGLKLISVPDEIAYYMELAIATLAGGGGAVKGAKAASIKTVASAENFSFNTSKNNNKGTSALSIQAEKNLLAAKPVGSALKEDDLFHNLPVLVRKEAAKNGTHTLIQGNDGTYVTLTQIEGSLNGVAGRFEYIVDSSGNLTHQFFVKGGKVNGISNKP